MRNSCTGEAVRGDHQGALGLIERLVGQAAEQVRLGQLEAGDIRQGRGVDGLAVKRVGVHDVAARDRLVGLPDQRLDGGQVGGAVLHAGWGWGRPKPPRPKAGGATERAAERGRTA